MGFKKKIYLFLAILLVVGYGSFTAINYNINESATTKDIKGHLKTAVRDNIDYIKVYINSKLRSLEGTADILSRSDLSESNRANLEKILHSAMKGTGVYVAFFAIEDSGLFVHGKGWVPPATFNFKTRPWWILPKEKNAPIVTNSYVNKAAKKLIVALAVPIKRDGKIYRGLNWQYGISRYKQKG